MKLKTIPTWAWIAGGAVALALIAGLGATYGGAIVDTLKIKQLIAKYRGVPINRVPDTDLPASVVKARSWMSDKEKNLLAVTPLDKLFDVGTLYSMNPDTLQPRQVVSIAATPANFVNLVRGPATAAASAYGLDPLLLIAQAAHESNWGKNAVGGTNLFGHIASPNWSATGLYSYSSTSEEVNGLIVPAYRPFRVYGDLSSAFMAHAKVLSADRYANAKSIHDPYQWGYTIASDGYATRNPSAYGTYIKNAYATVKQYY